MLIHKHILRNIFKHVFLGKTLNKYSSVSLSVLNVCTLTQFLNSFFDFDVFATCTLLLQMTIFLLIFHFLSNIVREVF